MKGVQYDDKKTYLSRMNKTVRYGKYTDDKIITTVNEYMFYQTYLELNNVIRYRRIGKEIKDFQLSKAPIELLVYLLCQDGTDVMIYRNKSPEKLDKISKDLGRSKSSISTNMSKLLKAGYIYKDEDGVYSLCHELRDLKKVVELHKDKGMPFKFDFLFKFCIHDRSNDSTDNR